MPHLDRQLVRFSLLPVALAAVLGVGACIEWDRSTSNDSTDIRAFVSTVLATDGREAAFVAGAPPASTGGPSLSAVLPPIVLKGGAVQVTFTATEAFSHIVFSVTGYDGYFDLDLGQSATSADALIVYAQDVGAPSFSLRYAGGSGAGIGAFNSGSTAFLGNGTGQVQVNITWNSTADVDLYVVDPLGEEIYYADRASNSGGTLDIDSNAGCGTDGPRAENIFWPFGVVPPRGEYTVRVNYWSACGEPSTDYVITVRTQNGVPQTFRGRLTGPGVGGAAGAGDRITDFRFAPQ